MAMNSMYGGGIWGVPTPLFQPNLSTPLDHGAGDPVIPRALLWAMRAHRRTHLGHHGDPVSGYRLGGGDSTVYAIDTDTKHCTIGRLVGTSHDGITFCLVATINDVTYELYHSQMTPIEAIFSTARNVILCAVYEGDVSNVADVRRFANAAEVPAEYLPPHPLIQFRDDT